MIAQRVKEELRRKGTADVMLVIDSKRAGKSRTEHRIPLEVDPEELAKIFLPHDHSFVYRASVDPRRDTLSPVRRKQRREGAPPHFTYFTHLGIAIGTVNEACLRTASSALVVRHVVAPLNVSPIRPMLRRQIAQPSQAIAWGLITLKIDRVWQQGYTGRGVRIGHIDTGVDATHSVLVDAVENFALIDDLSEVDPFQITPFDSDDHGTHTAAIIAGRPFGGFDVGAAPGALLECASVIEDGATTERILAGMNWAVAKGARILNVSAGVRGFDDEFLPLTRRLRELNVLPVFAVGNEGPDSSRSPGNYDEALSVGAINRQGHVATFSSYEQIERLRTVPDIVAPGEEIESALPNGGYQVMSGTSMAAPHISGLAALLWEAKPGASEDEIEDAIFKSAQAIAGESPTSFGFGSPDAEKALDLILGR